MWNLTNLFICPTTSFDIVSVKNAIYTHTQAEVLGHLVKRGLVLSLPLSLIEHCNHDGMVKNVEKLTFLTPDAVSNL